MCDAAHIYVEASKELQGQQYVGIESRARYTLPGFGPDFKDPVNPA